jgi:hypothetical protein
MIVNPDKKDGLTDATDQKSTLSEDVKSKLKKYVSEADVVLIDNAAKEYLQIKTAKQLADFHMLTLPKVVEIIRKGIEVSNPEAIDDAGNPAPANTWKFLHKEFPFVIVDVRCSECSAEAYVNIKPLYEKARQTPEDFDDLFYEGLKLAYEDGNEWFENWRYSWKVQDGCDFCFYSTLGMGTMYKILKELQKSEDKSKMFESKIIDLKEDAARNLSTLFYGTSKENVLKEYDKIAKEIKFQGHVKKIVEEARAQIMALDNSRFNCKDGNCDYDIIFNE